MTKTELATFDYSKVEDDTRRKLISLAGSINRAKKTGAAAMLEVGEGIAEAHDLLATKGKDSQFSAWIEATCGIERTSAYNYLWSFKRFGNCSNVEQFSQAGMYLLASPKAPKEAAKEAEKLAAKGVKITVSKANEILDRYKEEAEPEVRTLVSPAVQVTESEVEIIEEKTTVEFEPPKVSGGTSFDPAEIEAAGPKAIDIEALAEPYRKAVNDIHRIARDMRKIADDPAIGAFLSDKINRIEHGLDDVKTPIAMAIPTAVCGKCDGKKCKSCSMMGWWPKSVVESRK